MRPAAPIRQPSPRAEASVASRRIESTFADQVAYFLEKYPRGFQDPLWTKDQRGEAAGRRLKRHRAPALADARELATDVPGWLAEGRGEAAVAALHDLLRQTSLVPPGQVRRLQRLEPQVEARLLESLTVLLGDDARLGAWIETLSQAGLPAWELITAPLALAKPDVHVWVRPKLLAAQAVRVGQRLAASRRPTLQSYLDYQGLVQGLRERCQTAGLEPRDGLDVCDFVWTTLRPQARATLAGAHQRREQIRAARRLEAWAAA